MEKKQKNTQTKIPLGSKIRFLKKEKQYLYRFHNEKTPAQLAADLGKPLEQVEHWLKMNIVGSQRDTAEEKDKLMELKERLCRKPEWKQIRRQFTIGELSVFQHYYAKIISQFKDDVLATEEMQIFMLVKTQMLIDRNLADRKRSITDLDNLQRVKGGIYARYPDRKDMPKEDVAMVLNIDEQLQGIRASQGHKQSELMKLQEQFDALMKDLKGTREQRIKTIEDAKGSFVGWIKSLQNEEIREKEGREIEIMKLAINKEYDRLSSDHIYVDNMVDKPILNAETYNTNIDTNYNNVTNTIPNINDINNTDDIYDSQENQPAETRTETTTV